MSTEPACISLWMPRDLYDQVRIMAAGQGLPLSEVVAQLLEAQLAKGSG